MDFVEFSALLQQWKNFANRSRIDKIVAMFRVALFFLIHGVVVLPVCTLGLLDSSNVSGSKWVGFQQVEADKKTIFEVYDK